MRIVIVEDEAPIREGMAKILSKLSTEYELAGKAADGEAGYRMIRELKPDLVIMDIQMPKMDGLTMMRKLREEQIKCRVLVLSAYSDFTYAKQAIDLKIENYLLKPIKIPELKKVLRQIEEEIRGEQKTEEIFSLENILRSCMNGQTRPNETLREKMREKFGMSVEDPAELFVVWIGNYKKVMPEARQLLNHVQKHATKFESYILESEGWNLLIMVLYKTYEQESMETYFQKSVTAMLMSQLKQPIVCVWRRMDHLWDMHRVLGEMWYERDWNLIFPQGTMISKDLIEAQETIPLKYPAEIEDLVRNAAINQDRNAIISAYKRLEAYYNKEKHTPQDLKQMIMRFNWAVYEACKPRMSQGADLEMQKYLQEIASAVSWTEIESSVRAMIRLFEFTTEAKEDETASPLVQRAKQLIQKYYDQGITLEETADKLFVSEEYLSAQFKKETGSTFTETVRRYRLEKVKHLLLHTHLKLNQIAELAGYSDPKYMSKVFKEAEGMLPTEYRKRAR